MKIVRKNDVLYWTPLPQTKTSFMFAQSKIGLSIRKECMVNRLCLFLFNCGYLYFVNNCITIWVSFFTLAARKLKSNFAFTIIGSTYKSVLC